MNCTELVEVSMWTIFVIAILALVFGAIFSNMKEIPEQYCHDLGGEFVYYECQNIPFGTPCSELKTGFWCELPNNRSINETELWMMFNSTV